MCVLCVQLQVCVKKKRKKDPFKISLIVYYVFLWFKNSYVCNCINVSDSKCFILSCKRGIGQFLSFDQKGAARCYKMRKKEKRSQNSVGELFVHDYVKHTLDTSSAGVTARLPIIHSGHGCLLHLNKTLS